MFNKDEACFQKCIGHGGVRLGANYSVPTMTFPPKASILATPGLYGKGVAYAPEGLHIA